MLILARIRLYEMPREAADLFAQVVDEAADDRVTLTIAHEGAAACCLWIFERFDDALRHLAIACPSRWSWATRRWPLTSS